MKYVALLAICCLISSSPLFAQGDTSALMNKDIPFPIDTSRIRTIEFSVSGGISSPYLPQDFHDYWKTGWNGGVGLGMTFAPGSLGYGSVLLNFDLNRFAFDYVKYRDKFLQPRNTITRNPSWMVDVMLNFRATITSLKIVHPYVIFGIGYLHLEQGDIIIGGPAPDTVLGESKSTFAWDFGAGLDIPVISNFGIFCEARSVLGVTDPTRQYFPLRGGFRFRFSH